jgi:phosphoglycerate dehydrogenase-like enzyme
MKAVLHYRASPGFRARLDRIDAAWLDITVVEEADDARFAAEMRDADVLWHVLRPVSAADIGAAPKLRLIQKIGVGVNTIDLDAAAARGIAVCNMPGTNSRAVAEATLTLMLGALRGIAYFDPLTRAGTGWQAELASFDRIGEIAGRCVGLIGYGAVARALVPILSAMGARILYTARNPRPDAAAEWRSRDALLAEADIVSLHLPLTAETENMMDDAAFALMKPGAVLVNTARGGLVDEAALIAALDSGRLAAAGLDVFAVEPVQAANPLLARRDVLVMPHIAWATPETLQRSLGVAVENCRRLRAGEALLNRVVQG